MDTSTDRAERISSAMAPASVLDLIAARRPQTSWRRLATEVTLRTGIDVTGETLRRWALDAGISHRQGRSMSIPTPTRGDASDHIASAAPSAPEART